MFLSQCLVCVFVFVSCFILIVHVLCAVYRVVLPLISLGLICPKLCYHLFTILSLSGLCLSPVFFFCSCCVVSAPCCVLSLCLLFCSVNSLRVQVFVCLFVLHEFIWWSVFPSNKAAIRFRVRVLQLGPPSCLLHSKPWHWEKQHLSLLLIVECNLCFAQRFHCIDRQNCIVKVKLMRNHGVIILWQVHCPIKISFKLIRWCQK